MASVPRLQSLKESGDSLIEFGMVELAKKRALEGTTKWVS